MPTSRQPVSINTRHNWFGVAPNQLPPRQDAGRGQAYGGGDRSPRPASDQQLKFIRDLLRQVNASDEQVDRFEQRVIDGLASAEASSAIDKLVALRDRQRAERSQTAMGTNDPNSDLRRVVEDLRATRAAGRLNEFGASLMDQYDRRGTLSPAQIASYLRGMERRQPRQRPDLPAVPDGRYAVDSAEGELRFYRVVNRDGKVYLHVQHGGNESDVHFSAYQAILRSIVEAGPREAALRYGQEIGCCARCGTRLTNRLSRELNIGPICGGHWYEDESEWRSVRSAAREAIIARGEDPNENVEA
jgi:hypothetical protein